MDTEQSEFHFWLKRVLKGWLWVKLTNFPLKENVTGRFWFQTPLRPRDPGMDSSDIFNSESQGGEEEYEEELTAAEVLGCRGCRGAGGADM